MLRTTCIILDLKHRDVNPYTSRLNMASEPQGPVGAGDGAGGPVSSDADGIIDRNETAMCYKLQGPVGPGEGAGGPVLVHADDIAGTTQHTADTTERFT